ncbi:hypothetical protein F0919_00550 [Taibaiella lutea]|uniref:Hedgehog/Intein (Hint) domain-containing protein n=1 Tax=Taibaiella lutea TaxID=2608001 RepID=A0A5M6CLT8_9BACT|nr:hypothetical protein [Taibaiella lutea]KAA5536191.1 hypothetical protein F0919_00550 [Taibaiella lutea]
MSLASDTTITLSSGISALSELKIGDMVLAWRPKESINKPVIFSSGTEGGSRGQMVMYIEFDGNSLITTMDQVMILSDQTLKRADRLIAHFDRLLRADGQPVNVSKVSAGMYSKGLHHVAIDSSGTGGDHLIIANGVVCGDYLLETRI